MFKHNPSLVGYYKLKDMKNWAKFIDDLQETRLHNRDFFYQMRREPWLYEALQFVLTDEVIEAAISEISALRHRLRLVMDNAQDERHFEIGNRLAVEQNVLIATLVSYYLDSTGPEFFNRE